MIPLPEAAAAGNPATSGVAAERSQAARAVAARPDDLECRAPVPGPDGHPARRDRRGAGRAGRPPPRDAAARRDLLLGPEPCRADRRAPCPAYRPAGHPGQGPARAVRRLLGGPDRHRDRERYPAERATWNPPDGEPTVAVADRVGAALAASPTPSAMAASRWWSVTARRSALAWRGCSAASPRTPRPRPAVQLLMVRARPAHGRWRLQEYNAGTLPEPVLGDDQ